MAPDSSIVAGAAAGVLMAITGAQVLAPRYAWLPLMLFATTPLLAHAISNQAPLLSLLPFTTAWLAAMLVPGLGLRPWRLVVAGAALGAGLYAHPSGVVTMPLLWLVGLIALTQGEGRNPIAGAILTAAVFGVASVPLVASYLTAPHTFTDQVLRYGLYDAGRFNVLQGGREMASWVGLTARSEVFYGYFNPGLWFFRGSTIRSSLFQPEVFLLPLAALLPLGIYGLLSARQHGEAWLLLGGLAVAPFAAALTAQPPMPRRLVLAIPFVAWLATYGVMHLAGAAAAAGWMSRRFR